MKLLVEENPSLVRPTPALQAPNGAQILVTPPINEEFWWARVAVGGGQALVCFPKFHTIGIGFQREKDWNTNLPYTSSAEEIYDHIKHNRGRCQASRAECIAAIELLQEWAQEWLPIAKGEGE